MALHFVKHHKSGVLDFLRSARPRQHAAPRSQFIPVYITAHQESLFVATNPVILTTVKQAVVVKTYDVTCSQNTHNLLINYCRMIFWEYHAIYGNVTVVSYSIGFILHQLVYF